MIHSRNLPEVYKPLIDEALMKLVQFNEGETEKVKEILNKVKTSSGGIVVPKEIFETADSEKLEEYLKIHSNETVLDPLGYLKKSTNTIKKYIDKGKLKEKLKNDWISIVWNPNGHYFPDDDEGKSLDIQYYPIEAREALLQKEYMVWEDADVLGIWKKDGTESIYHAHPEGFWILGKDAIDWIENVVTKVYQ